MIDGHETRRAVLDASRSLLTNLYEVAEPTGMTDRVERIHHLLSRPGVTNGRDSAGLALVLVEGMAVLADAVAHRPVPPTRASKPKAKAG